MEHILENIGEEQYGFAMEIKQFLNAQANPESELTNKLSEKFLKHKNSVVGKQIDAIIACLKDEVCSGLGKPLGFFDDERMDLYSLVGSSIYLAKKEKKSVKGIAQNVIVTVSDGILEEFSMFNDVWVCGVED
ncbi:hypothetical protein QTV49_004773 [Vibrio vulnificus]|nr:hypothetical protein [Vibrio vulnificus]